MTRTRIKICGVSDAETARVAVDAGADAIGLVFVERSPRHVTVERARPIAAALPAFVEPVGLFVDASAEAVRRVAEAVGLRTVQLHGGESAGVVAQLAGLRVVKALPFDAQAIEATLSPWREAGLSSPSLAAILWDTPPKRGALPGGGGRAFDWPALAALREAGGLDGLPPQVLGGGLTPDNVAEAIRVVRPYAVDVSSGVESAPGVKDHECIRAFCEAVRRADASPAGAPRP